MKGREIVKYALDSLLENGAEKAKVLLKRREQHELNAASGDMSLLRTTFDADLVLSGIVEKRKGAISINKTDQESIDSAVTELVKMAKASKPDDAHDICEKNPSKSFKKGIQKAELDKMYDRMKQFIEYSKEKYPHTILEEINFDFSKIESYYINSNGTEYDSEKGLYNFSIMFTTKEGANTSSFNYTGFSTQGLEKEFRNMGSIETLLGESSQQTVTKSVPEKFTGDIIITPDCLKSFISYVTGKLGDYAMITGTSMFKDKLGEKIADKKLTLRSMPVSKEIIDGYSYSSDGFEVENSTIIEKGVLKTFLLSLYGANKTGLEKAVNSGGCYVVEPGDKSFEEIVKNTKRGILLSRFSGGKPSDNGDFSGVAKNSFYIEDGEIKYPVSETMISGNLKEFLNSISEISKERISYGSSILPWIKAGNITISGK